MSTALIVLLVLAIVSVPVLGIVATLSIYGVRKYIANAKTAEARNVVHQLARDAVSAYELEGRLGDQAGGHRICPSASHPVPDDRMRVSGQKYQSSTTEWDVDRAANAGFACLQFSMATPQYYQYAYEATPTGFVARAFGDLNGDGVFSTYELRGRVVGDRLVVDPSIEETDPQE